MPKTSIGRVAVATAGRGKGKRFVVVAEEGAEYLLLCDGRTRKLNKPKRKKRRHLQLEAHGVEPQLLRGDAADANIRRELRALTHQDSTLEEG
ncbi:MAG: KOW domain-containing RNA-binding protein [Christensenellaceae bacterium]|jgi:ribosomal protein L14E/L6E/L27E|nr:KOW domain-containing RNA-binding protein [Christensenellaceae bacterium]